MRMHLFTFYMRMYAYFGVRSVSVGVDFILGIKGILKPGLIKIEILTHLAYIANGKKSSSIPQKIRGVVLWRHPSHRLCLWVIGCPGLSESLLGALVILLVCLCCRSNFIIIYNVIDTRGTWWLSETGISSFIITFSEILASTRIKLSTRLSCNSQTLSFKHALVRTNVVDQHSHVSSWSTALCYFKSCMWCLTNVFYPFLKHRVSTDAFIVFEKKRQMFTEECGFTETYYRHYFNKPCSDVETIGKPVHAVWSQSEETTRDYQITEILLVWI